MLFDVGMSKIIEYKDVNIPGKNTREPNNIPLNRKLKYIPQRVTPIE